MKWGSIGTALFAVIWFLWFTFWQPKEKERVSLTENHLPSKHSSSVSPQPSSQAGAVASPVKPTDSFTSTGLWQGPNADTSPSASQASQVTLLSTPAEQSAKGPSSPPSDLPSGQRAGLTSTLESHGRLLPSLGVLRRAPHPHQPHSQGARTDELHRNAELATNRADALQSELTATEAKLQTTQKNAELVAIQKNELQNKLTESETRAQMVQKKADLLGSQRDALVNQLKEAETRAQAAEKKEEIAAGERGALQKALEESEAKTRAAQKDGELARRQLEALQNQLKDTEAKAEMAQKNADLATSQRDRFEAELGEAKERAQLAEMHANFVAGRQSGMEAQVKKTQEEKKKIAPHDVGLAGFHDSEPYTQSQKEREGAQPDHEEADLATNQPQSGQIQPPNPGQDVKLPPLTQVLDSSVQSDRP
ncbi:MAG: hypothetical protein JO279_01545 [Verrucomicrobia bacterium]|nr:hypothetical protein [Verrucomicrobiota bacterium]